MSDLFPGAFKEVRGLFSKATDSVSEFFDYVYDPFDEEGGFMGPSSVEGRRLSPSEEDILLETWNEEQPEDSPLSDLFGSAADMLGGGSEEGRERARRTSSPDLNLEANKAREKAKAQGNYFPEAIDSKLLLRNWIERLSNMDKVVEQTKVKL